MGTGFGQRKLLHAFGWRGFWYVFVDVSIRSRSLSDHLTAQLKADTAPPPPPPPERLSGRPWNAYRLVLIIIGQSRAAPRRGRKVVVFRVSASTASGGGAVDGADDIRYICFGLWCAMPHNNKKQAGELPQASNDRFFSVVVFVKLEFTWSVLTDPKAPRQELNDHRDTVPQQMVPIWVVRNY